jgi:hypothetical protein
LEWQNYRNKTKTTQRIFNSIRMCQQEAGKI